MAGAASPTPRVSYCNQAFPLKNQFRMSLKVDSALPGILPNCHPDPFPNPRTNQRFPAKMPWQAAWNGGGAG
jgi:hypothetical protein